MRVDNDREPSSPTPTVDFLSVISHGITCSLGLLTLVLGPMSFIYAHAKLPEPWSKVACVLGAVLAVVFLEQEPTLVLWGFLFSLISADTVSRGVLKRIGFIRVLGMGMISAVIIICALAYSAKAHPWDFWVQLVGESINLVSAQWAKAGMQPGLDWEQLKKIFIHQGPWHLLSLMLIAFWLGVGFSAHRGWFDPEQPWSAKGLAEIPLFKWPSYVFFGLIVVVALNVIPFLGALMGLLRSWMFIQGTVVLSRWLKHQKVSAERKALIYSLGVFPGFYALMGLGIVSPWLKAALVRRKTK